MMFLFSKAEKKSKAREILHGSHLDQQLFLLRNRLCRCNHRLIAPNWWEYVSEHPIRHSWSCESAVTSSKHPSICGLIHPLLPERWGPGIVPKLVTV
jgi:hypothetical protein